MTITGIPHNCAYATQVIMFVAHGQRVANAIHGFPVNLP
jgi:hypothetical protein